MSQTVTIEMLPADYGDALHLEYGTERERHHLWVDGGLTHSYARGWRGRIQQLHEEGAALDLLVVTHLDADHINGVRAFLQANRRKPLPVREVWFNGYRHIRPFGAPERVLIAEGAMQWSSRSALVAQLARQAPTLAPLALWLAAQQAWRQQGRVEERGIGDGEELGELLDGRYPTNASLAGQAVLRRGVPPRVELPGGAVVWVLSPTAAKLEALARAWGEYLALRGAAALLNVRSTGMLRGGDTLVPPLLHALTLQARRDFEPSAPLRERERDLAVPIAELAQRAFSEDTSVANGSSIALLFEYGGQRVLLAGDAHPSIIVEGLRRLGYSAQAPLLLDAFKLAHHGSRANTSPELLEIIRCDRYLLSTSGARFGHPDKECLARIIWANQHNPNTAFYWNYAGTGTARALALAAEQTRYGYRLEHLSAGRSLTFG
jgi:beta-lactamase superfamily II metal-dependent hydrolase